MMNLLNTKLTGVMFVNGIETQFVVSTIAATSYAKINDFTGLSKIDINHEISDIDCQDDVSYVLNQSALFLPCEDLYVHYAFIPLFVPDWIAPYFLSWAYQQLNNQILDLDNYYSQTTLYKDYPYENANRVFLLKYKASVLAILHSGYKQLAKPLWRIEDQK